MTSPVPLSTAHHFPGTIFKTIVSFVAGISTISLEYCRLIGAEFLVRCLDNGSVA